MSAAISPIRPLTLVLLIRAGPGRSITFPGCGSPLKHLSIALRVRVQHGIAHRPRRSITCQHGGLQVTYHALHSGSGFSLKGQNTVLVRASIRVRIRVSIRVSARLRIRIRRNSVGNEAEYQKSSLEEIVGAGDSSCHGSD